jgi:hypothetical protein
MKYGKGARQTISLDLRPKVTNALFHEESLHVVQFSSMGFSLPPKILCLCKIGYNSIAT